MERTAFAIDTDKSTDKVKEAIIATMRYAEQHRLMYINVDILLYHIVQQKEFIGYAQAHNCDTEMLTSLLASHIENIERIPEDKPYSHTISTDFAVLMDMTRLSKTTIKESLNRAIQMAFEIDRSSPDKDALAKSYPPFNIKTQFPVSIPTILCSIYNLPTTYASTLLTHHVGTEPGKVFYDLRDYYLDDINDYIALHPEGNSQAQASIPSEPLIEVDGFINGKKMTGLNKEILRRIISNTDKIIDKLKASKANGDPNIHIIDASDMNIGTSASPFSDSDNEGLNEQQQWKTYITHLNKNHQFVSKFFIGREKELDRAMRILTRREKSNVIFIGESGVGKTALIYELTRLIDNGKASERLNGMDVYSLDMASLIAGTSYHGELEKRVKALLNGLKNTNNAILYIDDIHAIMESNGGNSSVTIASVMKPYMDEGCIRIIGSTTYKEYNRSIANNKSISRHFQLIDIKEPSIEDCIKILHTRIKAYEVFHRVRYTQEAIRYAVEQSARFINDRHLPDKAIDIIDEAGSYLEIHPRLNKQGRPKLPRYQTIDTDTIRQVLIDVCRIDAKALAEDSNANLKNMADNISHHIYGQDEAIKQVSRAVMMAKAGLTDHDKPIASLLFVGPTGVGKTELCKVLARELGIELVRFDMSEYTEKHTVSKLIGSPAGYIGYEEGGLLTDLVRRTPNCVLLLDEIEKAHNDIYNILLQVMDYANLTDNKGNKTDFRNVILIMTSNAGAQYANQASIGFGGGQTKGEAMMATVKKTFKPEFLNRLSATVVFNDMDSHMASLILDKKLNDLSTRLSKKNVSMDISNEAHKFLLSQGFSARYGAREMDRAIQQHLTPLLMDEILFGQLTEGGNAHITVAGKKLKVEIENGKKNRGSRLV